MTAAVATSSSHNATETLPLTAYGPRLAHSEYLGGSAGVSRVVW